MHLRGASAITRDIDQVELHALAVQLSQGYLPAGWQPVASSAHTRVASNLDRQLYYKEFLRRSPAEAFKALLRGSRATRARRNADALLLAGIEAPQSVHWGKLPGGTEYLFSVSLPGRRIDHWLGGGQRHNDATDLATRRALLASLGTFIGRLHATGFIHGDLRPGNVLAERHGDRFRFALLDNERNQRRSPPPGRMLLRNLMQLNMLPCQVLGKTDRMRFFTAWRAHMLEYSAPEARVMATEAYAWAMRRLAPAPARQDRN
ncbi:MAG: lipopolysaccharide kinase InaA family protein [Halioglobus sp.]